MRRSIAQKFVTIARQWQCIFCWSLCLIIGTSLSPTVAGQTTLERQIAFDLALEERDRGNLYAAIDSLEKILTEAPELQRVRLELAIAYYHASNYPRARQLASMVAEDPAVPAAVRARVQRLLEMLHPSKTRHRFKPFLSLGLLSDSNVNQGPASDQISLGGGTTATLIPEAVERDDQGLVIQGRLIHQYRLPWMINVLGDDVPLLWKSKLGGYHTEYFHEKDRNLEVLTLGSGPTFFRPRSWWAGLNVEYNRIRLDRGQYASYWGFNPGLGLVYPSTGVRVHFDALAQDRDYVRRLSGRDSTYRSMATRLTWALPQSALTLSTGLTLFDENAEAGRYDHTGRALMLGGEYALDDNLSLYTQAQVERTEYEGDELAFGEARNEREQRLTLGAQYLFTGGPLADWKATASWAYTRNHSNIDIYDYRRHRILVGLKRYF